MRTEIIIRVNESLTDARLLPLSKFRFSYADYISLNTSLEGGICNSVSEKIVDFIFHYNNGILRPDKWDVGEPLRESVCEESKSEIIHRLSSPVASLILRRKKPNTLICLFNREHGPTAKGQTFTPVMDGKYGAIYISFAKKYDAYCSSLLHDFCSYLGTDDGFAFDGQTGTVLETAYKMDYSAIFDREEKDNVPLRCLYEWYQGFSKSKERIWEHGISYFFPFGNPFQNKAELYLFRCYSLLESILQKDGNQRQLYYFVCNVARKAEVPKDVFSDWGIIDTPKLVLYRDKLDSFHCQVSVSIPLEELSFKRLLGQTLFPQLNVYLVETKNVDHNVWGKYLMITKEDMCNL